MMKKTLRTLLGSGLLGAVSVAGAAGVENVSFSGFLTAAASYATPQLIPDNKTVSADGAFENAVHLQADTRFGLQVSAQVNPKVSITGQLLARGEGRQLVADWAYIKYAANDNVSVRAGRVKLPSFLISDYKEVGYAYPWVRPPKIMYEANPMSGIEGVDMLIRFNFAGLGLLIQPFYGTNEQETVVPQAVITQVLPGDPFGCGGACPAGTIEHVEFNVEGLRGLNIALSSDVFTLHASWFKTRVYQEDFMVDGDDGSFSSIGMTMDWKNIVLYAEGFVRIVDGAASMAFPNQEGGYVTLGYRFGKFLPHFTYGWLDDHNSPAFVTTAMGPFPTSPLSERDMALGFRYELGRGAALKFEAMRMTPETGTTGMLVIAPNDPTNVHPTDSVMVYSLAFDTVF